MKTLRDLRKESGISQIALAEILSGIRGGGAYQGPISNIERGEVTPTVRRLADILTALGYELHIEARKGRDKTVLDLGSLLGKLPRAKDASIEEAPIPIIPAPEIPLESDSPRPPELPRPSSTSLEEALIKVLRL